MRILFANGRQTYPLFQGGDGISFHNLFEQLQKDEHDVLHIGKYNPPQIGDPLQDVIKKLIVFGINSQLGNLSLSYSTCGYNCLLLEHGKFCSLLKRAIVSFQPDIILTQLDCSQDVIEIAASLNVKIIHFIHDHDPLNFLPINKSHFISHIIFNSKNTSQHYKPFIKCKSSIIYPPIRLDNYICSNQEQKFITMINPTFSKGVKIFEMIATSLPKEKFLLVKGWKKPETSERPSSNIEIWDRQYDMKDVYSQTKLLLVPSQWEETFGRIIPEAGINKIPIIASRIGGIPESLELGGILIDKFNDADAWVSCISQLLVDQNRMRKLGLLAFRQAKKFDFKTIYDQLRSVFNAVYHS
jgi:glycosyltransferase involved in cell wall biosynthesis